MKSDLETLGTELSAVEARLEQLAAGSDFDPDADFALKTEIGGIRGESARTKRLRREKWDREAAEVTELVQRRHDLKRRIAALEARDARKTGRAAAEAEITNILRAMLRPGDQVRAGHYLSVATVTRVNPVSVSIRLPSGHTDRLPFLAIAPLEWDRMVAEWRAREGQS